MSLSENSKQTVSVSLPIALVSEVKKDAIAEADPGEKPNESRVLRRIIAAHYAPRLAKQAKAAKPARHQKLAA
jgi:hypothetical protein